MPFNYLIHLEYDADAQLVIELENETSQTGPIRSIRGTRFVDELRRRLAASSIASPQISQFKDNPDEEPMAWRFLKELSLNPYAPLPETSRVIDVIFGPIFDQLYFEIRGELKHHTEVYVYLKSDEPAAWVWKDSIGSVLRLVQ